MNNEQGWIIAENKGNLNLSLRSRLDASSGKISQRSFFQKQQNLVFFNTNIVVDSLPVQSVDHAELHGLPYPLKLKPDGDSSFCSCTVGFTHNLTNFLDGRTLMALIPNETSLIRFIVVKDGQEIQPGMSFLQPGSILMISAVYPC